MESPRGTAPEPLILRERVEQIVAVFQSAVNRALARHKVLGEPVAVADAEGNVHVVQVEELERDAAARGEPITYDL